MEHRHLRYFVAVAEELHFTRAAARLNIAQPHLSQEIRKLEEEIGVTLFARSKRHVELTPAGRVFLDRVNVVLDAKDDAVRAAQRASRGETGTLSVAFVTSASFDLLPKALARFRRSHPDVEVLVEDHFSDPAVEAVQAGRLDACIAHPPRTLDPSIEVEDLYYEDLVALLPADHALANQPSVSLKRLMSETWLIGRRENVSRTYDEVKAACDAIGMMPEGRRVAVRLATLVCLVAGGFGITVLPESAARLGVGGVVFVPLEGRPIQVPLSVVTRRGHRPPALGPFVDVVRQYAQERRDAGRAA